eukprot:277620-Chlamydomonas_euryale.AAC.1
MPACPYSACTWCSGRPGDAGRAPAQGAPPSATGRLLAAASAYSCDACAARTGTPPTAGTEVLGTPPPPPPPPGIPDCVPACALAMMLPVGAPRCAARIAAWRGDPAGAPTLSSEWLWRSAGGSSPARWLDAMLPLLLLRSGWWRAPRRGLATPLLSRGAEPGRCSVACAPDADSCGVPMCGCACTCSTYGDRGLATPPVPPVPPVPPPPRSASDPPPAAAPPTAPLIPLSKYMRRGTMLGLPDRAPLARSSGAGGCGAPLALMWYDGDCRPTATPAADLPDIPTTSRLDATFGAPASGWRSASGGHGRVVRGSW